MNPTLSIAEPLLPLLRDLQLLELLYHSAAPGATVEWFDKLVAPEFWEIGASGRRYSRDFARGVLAGRQREPAAEEWRTADDHLQEVAPDLYLYTYTLFQPGRATLRASLWRRAPRGWRVVYHQGTVVQG